MQLKMLRTLIKSTKPQDISRVPHLMELMQEYIKVFGGATPKAVVEFDMFGSDEVNAGTAASATAGANGDVSILPRIRVAYAELNWGNHTLAFGQMNMLTITLIPESLTHIAFPVSYAAGTIGWRSPGIWGYHTFGGDTKLEFAWSIQRSQWNNNVTAVTAANGQNAGTASGIPAFEARLRLMFGRTFSFWVTGHYQQEDMNGPNILESAQANGTRSSTMTTYAYTAGMKLAVCLLTLQGSAWYGMNTGPLLGNIVQFPSNQVSVHGWGAWAQLGLDFTKNFSLWLMAGQNHKASFRLAAAAGVVAIRPGLEPHPSAGRGVKVG